MEANRAASVNVPIAPQRDPGLTWRRVTEQRRKMIVRTQMTFVAHGEKFTPSKVPAQFSEAHDPGVVGKVGRYRGVPVPYGSADFEVPDEVPEKIAFVHKRAVSFLAAMRESGAEDFWLHITYHYDAQCTLGFSKEELKMILELDCALYIDCLTAEDAEQARFSEPGDGALVSNRRLSAPGH